jgi:hypothetical protein
MGSGRKPSQSPSAAHYGFEAFQRNILFTDTSNTYRRVSNPAKSVTDADCYDLVSLSSSDPNWSQYFYFGGTGYSTSCE